MANINLSTQSTISPNTIVNKISYLKREIHENLTDTQFIKSSTNDYKWTEWKHAISSSINPDTNWYTRDEKTLNLRILPTTIGGIYEVGVKYKDQGDIYCVYGGRAHKVRKTAKGTTLRARLYYGYARNGSDFRSELEEFLGRGFHVYFRWIVLHTVTECKDMEKMLFKCYDYAFNKVDSPTPYRKPDQVLYYDTKTNTYISLIKYVDSLLDDEQIKIKKQIQNILFQNISTSFIRKQILNQLLIEEQDLESEQ